MSGMVENMRKPTSDRTDLKFMKSKKSGFTIIELLVCIAIIGVLTSLILPAVQMAREAARKTQCRNNLKQLALASHDYEDTHGHLPAGMDFQHVGPIVYLLPHLEQAAYYQQFSFDQRFVYWFQNPINRPPTQGSPTDILPVPRPPWPYAAERTLSMLLCPTAPAPESVGGVLLFVTHGTPGVDFTVGVPTDWYLYSGSPGSQILTRTFYAPCAGDYYYGDGKYRGAFTYSSEGAGISKGIRLTDIKDGLSNTLLFGETPGDYVTWDVGLTPQLNTQCIGVSGLHIMDGIDNSSDYQNQNSDAVHFGSRHNGVIYFAFADGSVRGIQNTGDMNRGQMFQMMLNLGGINVGNVVEGP